MITLAALAALAAVFGLGYVAGSAHSRPGIKPPLCVPLLTSFQAAPRIAPSSRPRLETRCGKPTAGFNLRILETYKRVFAEG